MMIALAAVRSLMENDLSKKCSPTFNEHGHFLKDYFEPATQRARFDRFSKL